MDFKIVSDSSSDIISIDEWSRDIKFASVPLKISTSEREFIDNSELDTDEMLAYLAEYKGRSGSSCPNESDWDSALRARIISFALP